MTQGAPTDVLDLDSLLTSRSLKPRKTRLGGRFWTLKRDFTAQDVVQFWSLVDQNKLTEALTMLVGAKDGETFSKLLLSLPTEVGGPILRQIYRECGVLKRSPESEAEAEGEAGESPASS